tara:strand:+ start:192 stop:1001 length:810 start_codon:yes stop_codon:yes gene_type:complete
MKKCTKCGIEKPLTEFYKAKKSKDGYRNQCKQCLSKQKKEHYNRPEVKEKTKQKRAKYYAKNRKRLLEKQKKYSASPEYKERKKQYDAEYRSRPEIKERDKKQASEYYARPEIKERTKQNRKKYYAENREEILEKSKAYNARPEIKERKKKQQRKNIKKQPACIYQIKNSINNRIYIGQTTRGVIRIRDHFSRLRGNYHTNIKLQQDFNEHGEEAFEWSIIKELSKDKDLLLLEEAREVQKRIDDGEDLYNLALTIEQLKMLNENQEEK